LANIYPLLIISIDRGFLTNEQKTSPGNTSCITKLLLFLEVLHICGKVKINQQEEGMNVAGAIFAKKIEVRSPYQIRGTPHPEIERGVPVPIL